MSDKPELYVDGELVGTLSRRGDWHGAMSQALRDRPEAQAAEVWVRGCRSGYLPRERLDEPPAPPTPNDAIEFVENDGGRAAAGFRGQTGDCVVRAIAIATGLPYREVYDALHTAALERPNLARLELRYGRRARAHASPRTGVPRKVYERYLLGLGWKWVPTMGIGTGCQVHVRANELPPGRLVLSLSRHMAAVVDGVLHDTSDCSRYGERCVYGYYTGPYLGAGDG